MLDLLQGCEIFKQAYPIRLCSHDISHFCVHSHSALCYKQQAHLPSHAVNYKIRQRSFALGSFFERRPLFTSSISGQKLVDFSNHRLSRLDGLRTHVTVDVASAIEVINDLGLDTLTFLGVTVLVVPAFKIARASPVRICFKLVLIVLICSLTIMMFYSFAFHDVLKCSKV